MATRSGSCGGGLWLWLGLAAVVILADQVTKTLIIGAFQLGDVRPVTEWFNLVRAHNKGAAFSFLADAAGWQRWFFTGLGLVVSGFIVWMIRNHPTQKLFCFAVTMIMGGALGNVIDRVIYGAVADFLNMSCCGIENPYAFNVADIAIFAGAIGLVVFTGGSNTKAKSGKPKAKTP